MPIEQRLKPAAPQPGILDFARAFRKAAQAVGFYPPAHPATGLALETVMQAARPLTHAGPLCLTVLPDSVLAGGVPVEGADRAVAEMAAILHRHGIGALSLNGKATADSWRALFVLLATPSDDVRAAGGFQKQWKATRHAGPNVLEIDFGELLLGRVGGDFTELAGVIGHYLETTGVSGTLAGDVLAMLARALDEAPDEAHAVDALVRELRSAAHLTRLLQPEKFDEVFRQAATLATRLPEGVMDGLLRKRGTPEALQGTLDVVSAFIERIPDESVAGFLVNAVTAAGPPSARLTGLLAQLVPDDERRRAIKAAARQSLAGTPGAFSGDVLAQWAEIEQQLESLSDRQFVPDPYARELHSARARSAAAVRTFDDPPERIRAWVRTVSDPAVRDADLHLLTDLSRLETDGFRWRDVLAILRGQIFEAAEAGDWDGAATAAEAIARAAGDAADTLRSPLAGDVLQECARNWVATEAMTRLVDGDPAHELACSRLLGAMGPAVLPMLVRRWAGLTDPPARERIEAIVVGLGPRGKDALQRLLLSGDIDVRCATIRMLHRTGGTEHMPALAGLLADGNARVQREALAGLAAAAGHGQDLAARAISRADDGQMAALVEMLQKMGPDRAVPVLSRLVPLLDPARVAAPVVHAVVQGLQRGRDETAADGLGRAFDTPLWRAPIRVLRFRSAARSALRAMGSPAAGEVLREVSLIGGRRAAPRTATGGVTAGGPPADGDHK